jgi:hypothetical protein
MPFLKKIISFCPRAKNYELQEPATCHLLSLSTLSPRRSRSTAGHPQRNRKTVLFPRAASGRWNSLAEAAATRTSTTCTGSSTFRRLTVHRRRTRPPRLCVCLDWEGTTKRQRVNLLKIPFVQMQAILLVRTNIPSWLAACLPVPLESETPISIKEARFLCVGIITSIGRI